MPTPTRTATQLHDLVILLGQNGQSAYVALSAQMLDDELQKVLIQNMPNFKTKTHNRMFKYPQPLSSFAAKIDIAHLFGLIDDKLYATLTLIREIRNEFAHPRVETHFRVPHIQAMLKKFDTYNDVVDPYALFGQKVNECLRALNPFHTINP